MPRNPRRYDLEYRDYGGKPEQIKKTGQRVQARRDYEKANGNLPSTVDVDHKKPIVKGGTNAPSNLRAVPRSKNRSFARTKNAGMK